jgi:hypothetical protein
MVKAKGNLLPYSEQDFSKEIQWGKTVHKSDLNLKSCLLGCLSYFDPLTSFISEEIRARPTLVGKY